MTLTSSDMSLITDTFFPLRSAFCLFQHVHDVCIGSSIWQQAPPNSSIQQQYFACFGNHIWHIQATTADYPWQAHDLGPHAYL